MEEIALAPKLAWLTVNHRCNLNCKWCYQKGVDNRKKVMSKELARKSIDLLTDLGLKYVILIGGEPTLWHYYFNLMTYIKDKGMKTAVVTNGLTSASHKFAEKQIRNGLTNATLSIKGFSKQEYEESTGYGGSFDVACCGMENLHKKLDKLIVSITITNPILEKMDNMLNFIERYKQMFFAISFEKPTILPNGKIVFDERMMPERLAPFIQKTLYPTLKKMGANFKMEVLMPHCHFENGFIDMMEKDKSTFCGCVLQRVNAIILDPDGYVLPCNHFVKHPLGQFGVDFTTKEEYFKWRPTVDAFYGITKNSPCEECANCSKWDRCGAGCRLFWLYKGSKELIKPIKPL